MEEDDEFDYAKHEKQVAEEVNEFIMCEYQFIDLEGKRLKSVLFLDECNLDKESIISLNIKSNMLQQITPVSMFKNLEILNIADNNLTSLDSFPYIEFLTHLDISQNKLTSIESLKHSMSKLKCLKMDNNRI